MDGAPSSPPVGTAAPLGGSREQHLARRALDGRAVVLLALLLFGWNLWGHDLWAPDEPYFGEGAREMVVDGEWLVPHVNGTVTNDKPPLFFWLIALFSLPGGAVTSLTARLPSALAALGTLLLTLHLGRRLGAPRTAALAGAILITTQLFLEKARSAQIDSLLCLLVLVALAAFDSFRRGTGGRAAGIVFWGAAGLAVLAKGPVGLLLPLGIAVVTLALDRDLGRWRRFAPVAGPLVFVAVVAPWVVATMIWGEGYSVWEAVRVHFLERVARGTHHRQPFWYYLTVLPYTLLPWSSLLPGALLLAWRRRRQLDDRFLLVYAVFVVLLFSISAEKRVLYVLPAVPAFALLMARVVAAVAAGEMNRRWITLPQGLVGLAMLAAGLAAPILAMGHAPEAVGPAWGLGAILAVGGTAVMVAAALGRALATVQASLVTMTVAALFAFTAIYPALDSIKSGRELAAVVRAETAEARARGWRVLSHDLGNFARSVTFYGDGIYFKELTHADDLLRPLASGVPICLLANRETLPPLPGPAVEVQRSVLTTTLGRRHLELLCFDAREP